MELQPPLPLPIDNALLDRWVDGTLSPEEAVIVDRWLAAHPARREELVLLRGALASMSGVAPMSEGKAAQMARTWTHRIVAEERAWARRGTTGFLRSHMLRRALWYAGAGLTLGGAILAATRGRTALHTNASKPAVSTYITQNSQHANIVLTDGTIVALGVASRLDVPADYPAGNHTLRLIGEAFFTVAHHEGTPFTVITGTTTARVLGTSFMVRHYSADTTTMVAVRDGKIVVHSDLVRAVGPIVLTAARQAEISRTGTLHVGTADSSQFSFVRGVLTLNGGTLQDAVPDLNRWYDADIRLGDPSLATQRLTGECAMGSLADLANYLEVTFNVRVERIGRVLTLFPR